MKLNRISMNEADASPGGGAAPTVTPTPPANQAASEAPANVTADQVSNLITEKFKALQNEFFASARKAGLLEKPKSNETPSATPSAAAPASSGLSAADVEAMLDQERVITRAQVEHKLTDAQIKRMKSALKAEKPEDISTWTTGYLADMGLTRANETSTPTPAAPIAPNTAPISDRGSPAPNGAAGWKFELSNPIGMSAAARAQMDAELGSEKARQMRLEAARSQAERMRVVVKP
jgi:hypothetical protein